MLSSSLSVFSVRETKVAVSASRVPTIRKGGAIREVH